MDLNEEEDIRMEESREEHWRSVSEDDDYKKKINSLKWEVYTKDKEYFIKRLFRCLFHI